jgi:hypothetical protein
MNSGPVNAAYDLLLTAIDLTRACCANDNYLTWLSLYSDALSGSAGIANYFANAALAFEEQAHPQICREFDVFDARDNLADILMASAPLSSDELRGVVTAAIREAATDSFPLPVLSPRHGDRNSFAAPAHLEWNGNGHPRSEVAR